MAKAGIIYGAVSGTPRRVVVPSNPDDDLSRYVSAGEELLKVDTKDLDKTDVTLLVEQAIGRKPIDPTCAIIDDMNMVIGVVLADPDIDQVSNGTLVSAPMNVKIGDTLIDGKFTRDGLDIVLVL